MLVCSEELASCQRELEVLSQQFSLKCLENGHLVQALDAERKALCQCQQENQDLRTRNQVRHTSVHLSWAGVDIARVCEFVLFTCSGAEWPPGSRDHQTVFAGQTGRPAARSGDGRVRDGGEFGVHVKHGQISNNELRVCTSEARESELRI